ncbi:alpha/beta hydrolase [uncultured Thiohalocapsa sp.]|uniref:alpha/beta hydrolase n=1 Tax=uncultured Thiohalocapsa sp. TaxID=768990 RepID=UPI0025FE8936|nr:alpha/beta hydrolase [uncultured Thiohalocapsa sp.]
MKLRYSICRLALVVLAGSLIGCGSTKPPSDQIFLMPAPDLYTEGQVDPFSDNALIGSDRQTEVLFATDRKPSDDTQRFAFYGDDRDNVLHLGEARIQLGAGAPITWEEARRISLLKSRTDKYPLKIKSIEEYGVLERTVPPIRTDVERSTIPGRQFAEAINERLRESGSKDVYIYVHGYKVEFENPILVAAELWHFLGYEGAFVAYSWPSTRKTLAYWSDFDDAINSARRLRALILHIAETTDAKRIHVVGYSAGTRLVARMLADLGLYGYLLDAQELHQRTKLGHVLLVGSDIDRAILTGYLLDGALRVPDSLTIYQSSEDSALRLSQRVFGRNRTGEIVKGDLTRPGVKAFLREHPELRIIDVTRAEGGTAGSGHGYFRESPWVSSDILTTLLYNLAPSERGLVLEPDSPIWTFPGDYIDRLRRALGKENPTLAVSQH